MKYSIVKLIEENVRKEHSFRLKLILHKEIQLIIDRCNFSFKDIQLIFKGSLVYMPKIKLKKQSRKKMAKILRWNAIPTISQFIKDYNARKLYYVMAKINNNDYYIFYPLEHIIQSGIDRLRKIVKLRVFL